MDSRKLAGLLLCAPGIPVFAGDSAILAGQPNTSSRTVSYRRTDIVPIATEIRYTTLIELPKEESIIQVTCGDKDYWPVNWSGNLAYIKPAKPGSETNLNLIAASGNVYSFLLSEVSQQAGAHADLKVFVTPADQSAIVAMKGQPQFVTVNAVASYKKAAEDAETELQREHASVEKRLEEEKVELRAAYAATIKHDYEYSVKTNNPFRVSAIYHDDRFTYIEARPQEAPSVYEIKDGKPSLIQYQYDERSGRYIVPKILDDGYLRIGKHDLKFHREANS